MGCQGLKLTLALALALTLTLTQTLTLSLTLTLALALALTLTLTLTAPLAEPPRMSSLPPLATPCSSGTLQSAEPRRPMIGASPG